MTMTPGVRKFALTAHVVFSVGWAGAVAAFLVLALAGLTSHDAQTVRAAYIAMDLIGWFMIVPLCLASLITGIVQSLGTPWGLFRHFWILMKFLIAVLLTALLFVHMQPTSRLAGTTAEILLSSNDLFRLRIQLLADAAVALLALLVATTLAVYKPAGATQWRRHKQEPRASTEDAQASGATGTSTPRWVKALVAAIVLVLVGMKLFLVAPHG